MSGYSWNQPNSYANSYEFQCTDPYERGWHQSYPQNVQVQEPWQMQQQYEDEQNRQFWQYRNEGTWHQPDFQSWKSVFQQSWQPEPQHSWSNGYNTAYEQGNQDWKYQSSWQPEQAYSPRWTATPTTELTGDRQVNRFGEEGQSMGYWPEPNVWQGYEATQSCHNYSEIKSLIEDSGQSMKELRERMESMNAKLAMWREAVRNNAQEELLHGENKELSNVETWKPEAAQSEPIIARLGFTFVVDDNHCCSENADSSRNITDTRAQPEVEQQPQGKIEAMKEIEQKNRVVKVDLLKSGIEVDQPVIQQLDPSEYRVHRAYKSGDSEYSDSEIEEVYGDPMPLEGSFQLENNSTKPEEIVATEYPKITSMYRLAQPETGKIDTRQLDYYYSRQDISNWVKELENEANTVKPLFIFSHQAEYDGFEVVQNRIEQSTVAECRVGGDCAAETVDDHEFTKEQTVSWFLDAQDLKIFDQISEMVENLYVDTEVGELMAMHPELPGCTEPQTVEPETVETNWENSGPLMGEEQLPEADFESFFLEQELPMDLEHWVGTPAEEKHCQAKRRFQHDYANAAAKLRVTVQGYPDRFLSLH